MIAEGSLSAWGETCTAQRLSGSFSAQVKLALLQGRVHSAQAKFTQLKSLCSFYTGEWLAQLKRLCSFYTGETCTAQRLCSYCAGETCTGLSFCTGETYAAPPRLCSFCPGEIYTAQKAVFIYTATCTVQRLCSSCTGETCTAPRLSFCRGGTCRTAPRLCLRTGETCRTAPTEAVFILHWWNLPHSSNWGCVYSALVKLAAQLQLRLCLFCTGETCRTAPRLCSLCRSHRWNLHSSKARVHSPCTCELVYTSSDKPSGDSHCYPQSERKDSSSRSAAGRMGREEGGKGERWGRVLVDRVQPPPTPYPCPPPPPSPHPPPSRRPAANCWLR